MPHLITFRSAKFDITKETPNLINHLAGESVLQWLREKLRGGPYEVAAPEAEDWGWYSKVQGVRASYLVGASAEAEQHSPSPNLEWTVRIDKRRSLKDKLTGTNKLTTEDPLSSLIERLLHAEPEIVDVYLDRHA
jgi:hypothetical protein